jgi:hypothetical protein
MVLYLYNVLQAKVFTSESLQQLLCASIIISSGAGRA